jgi:peptidoglycan hydrolase-like protein with peptidoglycan-binding domain
MRKITFLILLVFSFFLQTFQISLAEYFLNTKNLTIDSQTNNDKADIIRLQSILYINNLYDGPITGYYGKLTESAINRLKDSNGLNPDGVVDDDVIELLNNKYTACPLRSFLEKGDETPIKEIKFLQYFMRLIPDIYPEKLVTGYFGIKTENAVKRLQTNYLGVDSNGRINIATSQKFCEFFDSFSSDIVNTKLALTTSSIFQTLCLAFPKQAKTGGSVLFISQILGGNSPYSYS